MVVTFAGSLVSVGWLAVDDIRSHMKIGNDDESLQYKGAAWQLGFHTANMLFVERDCFDVKYYDLKLLDWFWISDGFLFIDPKVTVLPRETVKILITQELGHWHYRRSFVQLAFPFLRAAALTTFLIATYDSEFVNRLFSFPEDDPPDAIVPMLVAYQWVWPYVSDLLNFLQSWLRWRTVFATDEFACRHGRPIDLINALHVVAGTSETIPCSTAGTRLGFSGAPLSRAG
uniref:Ste24 endopeptidase n=2 Tax=Lygus hesperus TaxID=30085 RepID=A0A0A9YV90_LYGHE